METQTLMGAETEYALVLLDSKGKRTSPEAAAFTLLKLAQEQLPSLISTDGQGIFLGNGGKLYVDVGDHPEWATPECPTPWDLVRYTLAGDRIMERLAGALERSQKGSRALVFRGNTGYGDSPESWACHESYLCRRSPSEYTEPILPFLVSRMIYAGAGGFNPFSPGIEFTLSPRSHFLTTVTSGETMRQRPIMNLRDEPLASSQYHRLHLICADALGSQAAMWLRAGATALVIALIDIGLTPAQSITLPNPLDALRTFATDQNLTATVPTNQGNKTALDIQQHYLNLAHTYLPSGRLPWWAAQVLEGWQGILDLLRSDRSGLETALDWTIKREIYADHCAQNGFAWEALPHWTQVITRLRQSYKQVGLAFPTPFSVENAGDAAPVREEIARLSDFLRDKGLDWRDLPRFQALRTQLLELDTRFLQLGGLFHCLERDGVLDHHVLPDAQSIEDAVNEPPKAGRAAVRGRCIQQFAKNSDYQAGWTQVVNLRTRQVVSLSNPFTESGDWSGLSGGLLRAAAIRAGLLDDDLEE